MKRINLRIHILGFSDGGKVRARKKLVLQISVLQVLPSSKSLNSLSETCDLLVNSTMEDYLGKLEKMSAVHAIPLRRNKLKLFERD